MDYNQDGINGHVTTCALQECLSIASQKSGITFMPRSKTNVEQKENREEI